MVACGGRMITGEPGNPYSMTSRPVQSATSPLRLPTQILFMLVVAKVYNDPIWQPATGYINRPTAAKAGAIWDFVTRNRLVASSLTQKMPVAFSLRRLVTLMAQ